MIILAGDVGGTKCNLARFESIGARKVGPARDTESYRVTDFATFEEMLERYLERHPGRVDVASFGVAGPVVDSTVKGTNLPWEIDAIKTSGRLGIARVVLLNDLAATGYGIAALGPEDLVLVQGGVPDPNGNAGLIAAGTGLGESILARIGPDLIPIASEGGLADFAPRTDEEVELFSLLRAQYGRVSYERVLSGSGLVQVARWRHTRGDGGRGAGAGAWKRHEAEAPGNLLPAAVSVAGLDRTCAWCVEALERFVAVYGAEAGNLALRGLTRAGIYLGGGIAPKILSALRSEHFIRAFRDKEPHEELLSEIPIWVIQNERTAVLGAARYAALAGPRGLAL